MFWKRFCPEFQNFCWKMIIVWCCDLNIPYHPFSQNSWHFSWVSAAFWEQSGSFWRISTAIFCIVARAVHWKMTTFSIEKWQTIQWKTFDLRLAKFDEMDLNLTENGVNVLKNHKHPEWYRDNLVDIENTTNQTWIMKSSVESVLKPPKGLQPGFQFFPIRVFNFPTSHSTTQIIFLGSRS